MLNHIWDWLVVCRTLNTLGKSVSRAGLSTPWLLEILVGVAGGRFETYDPPCVTASSGDSSSDISNLKKNHKSVG